MVKKTDSERTSKNYLAKKVVQLTGRRTSLAPFAAASSIARRAWAMFLSLSVVTASWQSAILNWNKKQKYCQCTHEKQNTILQYNKKQKHYILSPIEDHTKNLKIVYAN